MQSAIVCCQSSNDEFGFGRDFGRGKSVTAAATVRLPSKMK
jgi:hypothetical protein